MVDIKLPVEVDLSGLEATINAQGEIVTFRDIDFAVNYASADASGFSNVTTYKDMSGNTNFVDVQFTDDGVFYQNAVADALKSSALISITDGSGSTGTLTGPHAHEMAGVPHSAVAPSEPAKVFNSYADPAADASVSGAGMAKYLKRHVYNYLIGQMYGRSPDGIQQNPKPDMSSVMILSQAGLAAVGDDMRISWANSDADAIAEKLKAAITTDTNAALVRQSIYEQLAASDFARLSAQQTGLSGEGVDNVPRNLPFQNGDSLAFLIKFRFVAPVIDLSTTKPFNSTSSGPEAGSTAAPASTLVGNKITVTNTIPTAMNLPAPSDLYCMLKLTMTAAA